MFKLTSFPLILIVGCYFSAIGQTTSPMVIASGGGYQENAGHTNSWTIGQPATQTFINGSNALTQGFQQPDGGSVTISGAIKSELGSLVRTVTVELTGQSTKTIITGIDGLYSFEVPRGGEFTVTPSKSDDLTTTNGITTLDIILMQKQILAIQALPSPYKIIAADVNASSTVTTLDIVLIRAVILVNSPTFPNGRLWAFVPSDVNFSNPLDPFPFDKFRSYSNISENKTNQDFIGIKLGDVNNSWDPNIPKMGAVGEVKFIMDEYNVKTGDEILVPVKVKNFKNISGYQFTLSWDVEVLSLLNVNNKSLKGFYGESKTSEGILTSSWYDEAGGVKNLDEDAVPFELKFKVIGTNGTQSAINIGSEPTVSEAYNEHLELLSIVPTNGIVKVAGDATSFVNLSVVPNPFSNTTNIIFSIPQDETVNFVIYDLLGKEVKEVTADYKSGEHRIEWAGNDDSGSSLSNGLYHVQMVAGDHSISKKVILIR